MPSTPIYPTQRMLLMKFTSFAGKQTTALYYVTDNRKCFNVNTGRLLTTARLNFKEDMTDKELTLQMQKDMHSNVHLAKWIDNPFSGINFEEYV